MVKQIQVFFLLFLSILVVACASTPDTSNATQTPITETNIAAFKEKISHITQLIDDNQSDEARRLLAQLDHRARTDDQHALLAYVYAKLALSEGDIEEASRVLNAPQTQQHLQLADDETIVLSGLLNADILELQQAPLAAARMRIYLAPMISNTELYSINHLRIWYLLANTDVNAVDFSRFANEQHLLQWLKLSQIVQHSQDSLATQLTNIEQWMRKNPKHPAALMVPADVELIRNAQLNQANLIAIILPLEGKFRSHGIAIRDGFLNAWYRASHKPEIKFYHADETSSFIEIYQQAISDGAELVIGPLFKEQLQALYQLGDQLPVPTIALNRLDNDTKAPANLFEFSLASEDEIASLILLAERQQHKNAIVIYQPDPWAIRAAETFVSQWQAQQGKVLVSRALANTRDQSAMVQDILNINNSRQRHRELQQLTGLNMEFEPRRRQDVDMILLISHPEAAATIRPLLSFHYANNIPVYATSSVYRGFANSNFDNDLNGISFTDAPLVINGDAALSANYRTSPLIRIHAMGMDAFLLSERLSLMAALPQAKVYGATGLLSMQENHIVRRTAFAQFNRGKASAFALPVEAAIERHAEEADQPIDWQ